MKISSLAIAQRHPKGLSCKTDRLYADVAEFIYKRLKAELAGMLDDNAIKRVSISCALFFEDKLSGTHQMDVFMGWHQKKFGTRLPIYDYIDKYSQFAMEFQLVLWLAIGAERQGLMINPENEGLEAVTLRILAEMSSTGLWKRMEPNDELADFLFCEETQTDIMEIKFVLIWLQHYSYFGHWYNQVEDSAVEEKVDMMLCGANDPQRTYAIDSIAAYELQTWPCSLKAQEIYAEMIRLEMEDNNDTYAEDIESIEYKDFAIYKIVACDKETITMQDYMGTKFKVQASSFDNFHLDQTAKYPHFIGSFVRFRGAYHTNGMSASTSLPDAEYEKYCMNARRGESQMHMDGQYDKFIEKNKGRRLYFFSDFKHLSNWFEKEHGIAFKDDGRKINKDQPFMLFFEPNGQFTLSNTLQGVKSEHNPYYDQERAPKDAFSLLAAPLCSSDCLRYLLENDLLPDAAINHIKGQERGREIVQRNAEFLARCFRRDIRW